MANEVPGAQLALEWLAQLISGNEYARAALIVWAKRTQPERWRRWAEARGKAEEDEALALDAVLAAQGHVIAGVRQELDKMAAVLEVQQALEGGGHGGSPGP